MNLTNIASHWKIIVEIVFLWYVIYMTLLFIKGTRAAQLLKGIIILFIIFLLSQRLRFEAVNWLLTRFFAISIIAFLIIFQPELRKALARLGQFGLFQENVGVLDELSRAAILLSKKRVGALIAVERETSLKPYMENSTPIDAAVSKELVLSILVPSSPIHDGGIIIQAGRIAAAGCLFPFADEGGVSHGIGTRHRAAMGLSDETDAVVIVVSEETGDISISTGGKLTRTLDEDDLNRVLKGIFSRPKKARRKGISFRKK